MILEGHTRTCTGLVFPHTAPSWMPPSVISCGADCSVRVWDLAQRRAAHDTGMLGAAAICTVTQLASNSRDELRVACGTLDSRMFVFALKAWGGAQGGGVDPPANSKMFLHLLYTLDTAPTIQRLFFDSDCEDAVAPPSTAGGSPVVRIRAPARRVRRGATDAPVQHPTGWDDSTVISKAARDTAVASPAGGRAAPPRRSDSRSPMPILRIVEVHLPSTAAFTKRSTTSRWSGGGGMFGQQERVPSAATPLQEDDALPAWAQPACASDAPSTSQTQGQEHSTACTLIATPFHVLLVSKVSNKVLFAAAMQDLRGGGHDDDEGGAGMLTHVLQAPSHTNTPTLFLCDQEEPLVHHIHPLCMPDSASSSPWLDAQDKAPDASRVSQLRAAAAKATVDPTLPSWLQSPSASGPEADAFGSDAPRGVQCPPLTLFPAGQLPEASPLVSATTSAAQGHAHSAMEAAKRAAVPSTSLPPRREKGGVAVSKEGGGRPASGKGPSAQMNKTGRSIRSSGYGSVKPRAMFGADRRPPGRRGGADKKAAVATLSSLAYPPQPGPPGQLDSVGTSSLGALCHVSSVSPPAAAVSSSGFFASAKTSVRGMGMTSVQWSSTGNSMCVGYSDGSVATASMPSVWRKAVLQGDAALSVQCAAAVRRYSTASSRPARAIWSHEAYAVAAGKQLKQAAGGSSADLLGSQRDVLQSGSSAPLLVGWGHGSEAVHVWGTAADVPLLVMDCSNCPVTGGVVDAGFVYGDAALAVAREGSLHLHKLLLREGVEGTASAAAGVQQRHPRGNKSKLLASCAVPAADGCKVTAVATLNCPRSTLAVVASSDRALHIVDIAVGAVALSLQDAHTRAAHALALPQSSHAASLSPAGMHTLLSAAPSDSAAVAAAGRAANSGVLVWDLRCAGGSRSSPVASLSGHSHRSAAHSGCLAMSPCGQYAAVGSDDNAVYVYDLRMCVPLSDDAAHVVQGSCSFLSKLRGARDTVAAVAFNPHTPCLAAAGLDGVVRLYSDAHS